MGFEGHVFDMINRIRQNREMLQSRRERTRKIREMYIAHYTQQTTHSPDPPNLQAIKEEIRKKLQQERKRALLYTICIVIILLIIIGFLVLWISTKQQR